MHDDNILKKDWGKQAVWLATSGEMDELHRKLPDFPSSFSGNLPCPDRFFHISGICHIYDIIEQ